jgi:hypothetical protein
MTIENRVIADGNPVTIPTNTDATSTAETWPVRMSPRKVPHEVPTRDKRSNKYK